MTREEWDDYCKELQELLARLCNHEIDRWNCYEQIKEIFKPSEFND